MLPRGPHHMGNYIRKDARKEKREKIHYKKKNTYRVERERRTPKTHNLTSLAKQNE